MKSLAKVALPIAGKALGSFIPIPGVGTMIGRAIGRAAANALELEYDGMDPGQADIEKARRVVRVLRSAVRDLSSTLGPASPESVRSALTSAVQRNIPGVNLSVMRRPRATGTTIRSGNSPQPDLRRGRWWRRGNSIVIDVA